MNEFQIIHRILRTPQQESGAYFLLVEIENAGGCMTEATLSTIGIIHVSGT